MPDPKIIKLIILGTGQVFTVFETAQIILHTGLIAAMVAYALLAIQTEGMILNFYHEMIYKLSKKYRLAHFFYKITGGCLECTSFWVSVFYLGVQGFSGGLMMVVFSGLCAIFWVILIKALITALVNA